MFDSFVQYQQRLADQFFQMMRKNFDFTIVEADQSVDELNNKLRSHTERVIH